MQIEEIQNYPANLPVLVEDELFLYPLKMIACFLLHLQSWKMEEILMKFIIAE